MSVMMNSTAQGTEFMWASVGGWGAKRGEEVDLFEEAVDAAFIASLEQGGDGQGGNAAVLV